jgi:hypothetical protein
MFTRSQRGVSRVVLGVICLAIGLLTLPAPASAGFLERLFGAFRHSFQAPRGPIVTPYADRFDDVGVPIDRGVGGPPTSYCVRSCDGHYFPVQAHPGFSAAEACRSFCPAAKTQLYYGNSIDTAVAANGSRYADLPNARPKQPVAGCTCNGRDSFGLARMDPTSDPTLQPGDIVATETGLVAFTGGRSGAAFTPVRAYPGLSPSERRKLSDLKISRSASVARAAAIPSANKRETDGRSVQLER